MTLALSDEVKIYVRRRKIMREGKRIDGWQAGFTPGGGGVTHKDKNMAIDFQWQTARRYGFRVTEVVEESNSGSPSMSRSEGTERGS